MVTASVDVTAFERCDRRHRSAVGQASFFEQRTPLGMLLSDGRTGQGAHAAQALSVSVCVVCVCVLLGIGAAPVVRPFTARPRSSHYGWENGPVCRSACWSCLGRCGACYFRPKICFWRPRHAGSVPKAGEGCVMAERLSVEARAELERRCEALRLELRLELRGN
jgi:hypothetical protein